MSKIFRLVLLAVVAVGLLSTAAFAQVRKGPPTPDNPNLCVAACGPIRIPVSPTNYKACGDKLAQLPKFTIRQVEVIDKTDRVHIVPLCDSVGHSLTKAETTFLARGNVSGLLVPIGKNAQLMAALTASKHVPNDVLGIIIGKNAVILYVHKQ